MRRREFLHSGMLAAAGLSTTAFPRSAAPRVLIAGGGFAGASCALQLRRLNPTIQVTLVDPEARYVTCPMSNEVLAALRTLDTITVSRAGLERAGVRCVHDRLGSIDAAKRTARLGGGGALTYDRLVLAPGIRLLYGTPEGYDADAAQRMPHAWLAGAQTTLLASYLHAMPEGGTVAISVPAGLMRCPPGPYERASLMAYWLKAHKPRSKILIFDANNHFPRQDVFTDGWERLYPGMIEWIAPAQGGAVTRVDAASGTLYHSGGAQRVEVANIIPPQAPGLVALENGLASGHGWCPVKAQSFESELMANVHVIGDACIAGEMPKSASAAHSQARRCAAAIAAAFEGREAPAGDLDSVCYSLLDPKTALAMRGHFTLTEGEIRQSTAGPGEAPGPRYAEEAAAWYRDMRRNCFAA
jgi:NADPH-dependent 2,4-dienoyl-CoA reductase/sulfur reductase-like enzyme